MSSNKHRLEKLEDQLITPDYTPPEITIDIVAMDGTIETRYKVVKDGKLCEIEID